MASTEVELEVVTHNGNDGPDHVPAGNGSGLADSNPGERDGLLNGQRGNGEITSHGHAAEKQRNNTSQEGSSVCRVKKELNEVVFWRVRLWMIIIFLFLLIFAIILISLAVCSAIYEDEDEKYNAASFNISRSFNGSFTLPNLVYTEELLTISHNNGQTLATDLQNKLADLYSSSPALGRYFSKAKIDAFRNGSVIADYWLTFLMPPDKQEELKNFTLSRGMVYNVFRQFLYDQEADESERMYIDPTSLTMF